MAESTKPTGHPMAQTPDISHGAHLVSRTSFGTVVLVALALFVGGLATGQPLSVYLALVTGVTGACFGYWLWQQGHHMQATALHTSGLVGSGLLCLAATETMGGPTAILLLASVITAGGLAGRKGAVASVFAVAVVSVIGHIWPSEIRQLAGLSVDPFPVPEIMMVVFVGTSIPSWAAYVVAVDASNRTAWLKAEATAQQLAEANESLAIANRELQLRQANLQSAMEQQSAVARLGVFTAGASSPQQVRTRASRLLTQLCGNDEVLSAIDDTISAEKAMLARVAPEHRDFARAILQLVRAHASRSNPEGPASPYPPAG